MSICALRRLNGGTIQSPGQKRNASSCSSALALVVTVRCMLEAPHLVRRQRWSYHSAPISYSTTLIGESSLQQGRASHRSCPCFAALEASGELNTAELLFGRSHIYTWWLLQALAMHHGLCQPRSSSGEFFHGRVTEVLSGRKFDPAKADFYLCVAPAMMDDCRTILANAGTAQVLIEPL
jgi:hypothetical protein